MVIDGRAVAVGDALSISSEEKGEPVTYTLEIIKLGKNTPQLLTGYLDGDKEVEYKIFVGKKEDIPATVLKKYGKDGVQAVELKDLSYPSTSNKDENNEQEDD